MRNQTQRRPEDRLAADLGMTTADLERIVRHERARDRAGRLADSLRMVLAGAGYTSGHVTPEVLRRNGNGLNVPILHLDDARSILAEIDAPIGGA